MLYFKNIELAEKYHISLGTVRNWIEASQDGRLDLTLHNKGGRPYVANTASNISRMELLAESGKKYRNTRAVKTVKPAAEFYELFTNRQILEIITNLKTIHEIDYKYNYMGDGASNWELLAEKQEQEQGSALKSTMELAGTNLEAIDRLLQDYKHINVVDMGPGNARPAMVLVEHLLNRGVLKKYIAIDISKSMLDLAERNIKKWFGDKVSYEGYVRDFEFERFDDVFVDDMLAKDAGDTANLVLLFGGTAANFPSFSDSIRIAHGSMGANDLLVYASKPDSESSRRYFDFDPEPGANTLAPNHRYILGLLGISPELYDVDMGYDEQTRMRYVRIVLKSAITIQFQMDGGEYPVQLEKGTSILLLRMWHLTALEIISEFDKCGFVLLQAGTTKDRGHLLTVSGIDARRT